jgi:tetratricopeptide (TPR) repeat protein
VPFSRRLCSLVVALVPLAACQPQVAPEARLGVDPISFDQFDPTPPGPMDTAWEHLVAERYGSALQIFRHERALDPDAIEPIYGLALAYAGIGRDDLSDRYFALAEQRETRRARLLTNLAYRDRIMGRFEQALARRDEAVALEPDHPVTRANIPWYRRDVVPAGE